MAPARPGRADDLKAGASGVVTWPVITTYRWTAPTAVALALVVALGVPLPGPTGVEATRTDTDPPVAGSVAVPVVPDEGGHRIGDGHGHAHDGGEFQRTGTRWSRTDLTFGFVNHTRDLTVAAQEAAIAGALASWAGVSGLTFRKVPDCGTAFDSPHCQAPDIRIVFGTGDHGGGVHDPDFDGPGGTAAHGFYPPPNGASAAGDLHFDDGERWTTTGNGVDLRSVALHELGHGLGLGHASGAQCPLRAFPSRPIMCSTIVGVDRTLATDDVNGIRALYGPPAVSCGGRAVTVDLNEGDRPTAGADVVLGTPGDDRIVTGAGADVVCGGGGSDTIELGAGNDRAIGGAGNDRILGGSGRDLLEGGGGHDRLVGGDHDDRALGGTGADVLDGGRGHDRLEAGPQVDTCNGRGGRDAERGCERRRSIESRLR